MSKGTYFCVGQYKDGRKKYRIFSVRSGNDIRKITDYLGMEKIDLKSCPRYDQLSSSPKDRLLRSALSLIEMTLHGVENIVACYRTEYDEAKRLRKHFMESDISLYFPKLVSADDGSDTVKCRCYPWIQDYWRKKAENGEEFGNFHNMFPHSNAAVKNSKKTPMERALPSCFKTLDPAADFERMANNIAEKYDLPNLPRMRHSDYMASIPNRNMRYRVEILILSDLETDHPSRCDMVYDFQNDTFTGDLCFSEGYGFYHPNRSPHIQADLRKAKEIYNEILDKKDEFERGLVLAYGGSHQLRGCWIIGCDPESDETFEYCESEWVAVEGDSHYSLKGERQLLMMMRDAKK